MNIELNKKYLLRNGSTVTIETHEESNMMWPFGGTIRYENGNVDRAAFFTYLGMYNPERGENERDIVQEIK